MNASEVWIEILVMFFFHSLWIGLLAAGTLGILLNFIPESKSRTRYAAAWTCLVSVIGGAVLVGKIPTFLVLPEVEIPAILHRIFLFIWLIGFSFCLLRLFAHFLGVSRMRRTSVRPSNPEICRVFERIFARMNISRRVELRVSSAIRGPLLIGWLTPTVVIPAGWLTGVPTAHLEAVFAHELAHARRFDFAANLIQRLIESVLFFNPAVWWISAVIRNERENACDDVASDLTRGPSQYSRALVWFEAFRNSSGRAQLAPGFGGEGGSLKNRVNRLMRVAHHRPGKPSQIDRITGMSALILVALLGVVLISGTQMFARSSLEIERLRVPLSIPQPTVISDPPIGPEIRPLDRFFDQRVEFQTNQIPLFRSVKLLEKGGQIINLNEEKPQLFSEFPNRFILENELDPLDSLLPYRDHDGDGFTLVEEFQAGTHAKDAESHPAFVEKLNFIKRHVQSYQFKFTQVDTETFQIRRIPSAKWPQLDNFIVKLGEKTGDGQLELVRHEEKSVVENGIRKDASVLVVNHLPTGQQFQPQENQRMTIRTFFAELKSTVPKEQTFFVKEGDAFVIPGSQETWTVDAVTETHCILSRNSSSGERERKTLPAKTP